MILQSIVIQDFRKLADWLVIDGFEPGLNIIAGPNETGKSTIAEAICTVFLERYKVSTLSAIVPAHRPDGQPTVDVKFTVNGTPHLLKKSFVRKSRCELRIGAQTFSEDEAEEKLAELLGFSRTERDASKPEHAGIPGLLWVRQGQTDKVRELRLRADALDLLESVLVDARDTAVATLRAPLTQRIGHYLKRVFPAGELSVDDDLTPVALVRGEQPELLDSLSYGTQEQLGILARLAYADLLQAAGRPTLLLFDDAVVHTDDARCDGIKRALLEAAKRHQILVLTCHPGHWTISA